MSGKKLIGVLILVAAGFLGFLYFGSDVSSTDPNQKVPKVNMILEVTTNSGEYANVTTSDLENGNGSSLTVETPYSKKVRSSYAKITAEPSLNVKSVSCRIINADNGNVLDKDGPSSRRATCTYDTTK